MLLHFSFPTVQKWKWVSTCLVGEASRTRETSNCGKRAGESVAEGTQLERLRLADSISPSEQTAMQEVQPGEAGGKSKIRVAQKHMGVGWDQRGGETY